MNFMQKAKKIKNFPYGKYKGRSVKDIAVINPSYVLWWARTISDLPIKQHLLRKASDNYFEKRSIVKSGKGSDYLDYDYESDNYGHITLGDLQ